ncbi:hypothetical protein ABT131_03970 [Streptomyces sp900105245]|uniref:hypothetical protein n=1 Tax=Streptomyces sp. 900105245 TaxID=3154379 RepID=UPI0033223BCE
MSTMSAAAPRWPAGSPSPMPAHAILAVEHAHLPVPAGLIPLTCDAIRRLFITHAVRPLHDVDHRPK